MAETGMYKRYKVIFEVKLRSKAIKIKAKATVNNCFSKLHAKSKMEDVIKGKYKNDIEDMICISCSGESLNAIFENLDDLNELLKD